MFVCVPITQRSQEHSYLAVLPLHVGDVDLSLGEEASAVPAGPALVGGFLGTLGTIGALLQGGARLLLALLHAIEGAHLSGVSTGHHGVGSLGAQWQVDPQVWRPLNGL